MILVLASVATATTLSGCFLTPGEAHNAEVILPKVSRSLRWAGAIAPHGSTLSEAARGLGTAIDTGVSINATFEKIAASQDPFGEALVTATCYGLTNIANQYQQSNDVRPASVQSWEAFLNDEVAALLPGEAVSLVSARVTQFNNAAELASVQPRYAYIYVNQCVLGRR